MTRFVGKTRFGMTVIELIAATSLCALLMTLVISVLVSLAAVRRATAEQIPIERWQDNVAEQIRWDLSHASKMHWKNGKLTLQGLMGRDFTSDKIIHCGAEISYGIQRIGGTKCLVRREVHLHNRTNRNSQTAPLAFGVAKFNIVSHGLPFHEKLHDVPDAVSVYLSAQNHGDPILNELMRLR